jgi:hypothetical protein
VITRGGSEDGRLERQMLDAAITACGRSERLCGPHAEHHDHCRIHAARARDTIAACEALLVELG